MVVIDMEMPSCCDECNAVGQFHAHTNYGDVNLFFCPEGSDVTEKDRESAFKFRPDWCPMVEVEEKRIHERVNNVEWKAQTVYVRKES